MENYEKLFSVLANKTRLDILRWLKNPEKEFKKTNLEINSGETIPHMMNYKGGICVTNITKRSGMAQSTISKYLMDLEKAGLLISERHEKWNYYRRNGKSIQNLFSNLEKEL